MSAIKNKKALLEKLKRQKEKQKKNVFTIPKIKPSAKEKNHKASKSFIPTSKTMLAKSTSEDKMRDFLTSVISLTDIDFEFNPTDDVIIFENTKVNNGYKEFVKDRIITALQINSDSDRQLIKEQSKLLWSQLPIGQKMIWVIVAYGNEPTAEWGRKKFTNEILLHIKSEDDLRKLIEGYILSNTTYDRFLDKWFESGGKDALNLLNKELEKESGGIIKNRLPITEEEQDKINDLNYRLKGFEDAKQELQEKETSREEYLSSISREDLVEIVKPIINVKTNQKLIDFLIEVKFTPIEQKMRHAMYDHIREQYKKTKNDNVQSNSFNPSQNVGIDTSKVDEEWRLYIQEIQGQRATYELELYKLSRGDLVLESIKKKDIPSLIKLILIHEFKNDLDNIKNKIFLLTIEIHNLSLGTYVPRYRQENALTSNEKKLTAKYLLVARENELKNMSIDQLNDFASQIAGVGHSDKKGEIISEIIKIEFPDDDNKQLSLSKKEVNNALIYLPEERLRLFAIGTMTKIHERGRFGIIEKLLSVLFPTTKKSTQKLFPTFVKAEREKELELMSSDDIALTAFQLGIDIPYSVSDKHIINKILQKEEKINLLITEDEYMKRKLTKKISKITGRSKDFYNSWSLEDLEQRLEAIRDEDEDYMIELEQERLFKKLNNIGDISKYPNANTWSIQKLRETLENIGGLDWENYKPLIEDYSYTNCVSKYKEYEWIEGKVTAVWLTAGIKGRSPRSEYIFKNVSIIENGVKWYQANKRFFSLQCNSNKNMRTQNKDILSCYTQSGMEVQFKVGFTITGYQHSPDQYQARTRMVNNSTGQSVQRSFIIQDEKMFQKERSYDHRKKQNLNQKVKYIENSPVDEQSIQIATQTLSQTLMSTLENPLTRTDYGIVNSHGNFQNRKSGLDKTYLYKEDKRVDYNTQYMQILMGTILSGVDQTNKDLFTKVANIIVYLKIPQAKMFRQNVSNEYYLPDILPTLSAEEKFPEVFEDILLPPSFISGVVATINNSIDKEVNNLAERKHFLNDGTAKKTTTTIDYSRLDQIKTNKRISLCQNKEKLKKTDPSEIVYYLDDNGQIYCFTINELYEQFKNDNIVNPETGNNFNNKFINRFNELYNNRLSSEGFLDSYFQDKYGFNINEQVSDKRISDTIKKSRSPICPDLWNIIAEDITELEDQLSNDKPYDGDEIDENREIEKREQEHIDGYRETPDINPKDACVYCRENLADDSIKSIIMHNDESRIIKFCSLKCFENKNDWEKYKVKRKKVKRKKDKENKPLSSPKLTNEERNQHKKIIKDKVVKGIANLDRIAFPLMSKQELVNLAKEKNIKIPGSLSKMETAKFLFDALHPKANKGIYTQEKAEREINKDKTSKDKTSKDKTSKDKTRKDKTSKDKTK